MPFVDVLKELKDRQGIFTDEHFVYQSEKHGSGYANFDVAFPDILLLKGICDDLVHPFLGQFDVVVSAATGGVAISVGIAMVALDYNYIVSPIWADKVEDEVTKKKSFIFERQGFASVVQGKRVLVADDVMTNANETGTVFQLCRLVEAHGGIVIGASIVTNRCHGTKEMLGIPELRQLSELNFTAVSRLDCEDHGLCAAKKRIVSDIGHGAEFQKENPDYPGKYVNLLS